MSLRTRLIAALIVLTAGGLVTLAAVTYAEQRSFLFENADNQARDAQRPVSIQLAGGAPPPVAGGPGRPPLPPPPFPRRGGAPRPSPRRRSRAATTSPAPAGAAVRRDSSAAPTASCATRTAT